MQREYFVLLRARSQQHPLLAWDQGYRTFLKARPIEVLEPVPPRPVMVDHHSLPAPVVSSRVKEALEAMQFQGVQLVPADVRVGDQVFRYWLLHMWRRLPCVDRERSVLHLDSSDGGVLEIERLVLDEAVLRELPMEERLVFRLEEAVLHLFHASVVDRVMSLTPPPEGLCFIPLPEWNDSSAFQ